MASESKNKGAPSEKMEEAEREGEGAASEQAQAERELKDVLSEKKDAPTSESKGAASDKNEVAHERKGSVCGIHGQQRQVTIAVDASDKSMEAVSWAARNLVHPGDAVTLLHVQPKPDLNAGVLPLKDGKTRMRLITTCVFYEDKRPNVQKENPDFIFFKFNV